MWLYLYNQMILIIVIYLTWLTLLRRNKNADSFMFLASTINKKHFKVHNNFVICYVSVNICCTGIFIIQPIEHYSFLLNCQSNNKKFNFFKTIFKELFFICIPEKFSRIDVWNLKKIQILEVKFFSIFVKWCDRLWLDSMFCEFLHQSRIS